MTTYELHNEAGDRVLVNGNRIAHVTTDDGRKPRWIELSVFELDAGGWVYHTVGKSVVFHWDSDNSPCTKGSRTNVSDLEFENLEPCPTCRPVTDPPSGTVLLEDDLHTLTVCHDYDDIMRAAKIRGELTGPSRQLLHQLAQVKAPRTITL